MSFGRPAVTREPTDARILALAGMHLRRFGRTRLTIVGIAEEAGMTHANVYRYFRSKEALVDAVVERWLRSVERRLADIADGPDPADDKLERLILGLAKAYRDTLAEDVNLFDAFTQTLLKRRPAGKRHRARIRALIERVLDEGIATGTFEPREREQAVLFVLDTTHRFIHPASMALEADVPQSSLDARLGTILRVTLRVLANGAV
jgi:AcrR family transcriptional regulator